MKEVHIWIASHIFCELRLKALDACLKSIANQSVKPNKVCISISGSDCISLPTDESIRNNLEDIPISIFRHEGQLSQFGHIKHIWKNDEWKGLNNWVVFCDDDDLCGMNRISSFLSKSETKSSLAFFSEMYRFCDRDNFIDNCNDALEQISNFHGNFKTIQKDFACLICEKSIIDKFFNSEHEEINYKYTRDITDAYFMCWVDKYYGLEPILGHHYLYRRNFLIKRN